MIGAQQATVIMDERTDKVISLGGVKCNWLFMNLGVGQLDVSGVLAKPTHPHLLVHSTRISQEKSFNISRQEATSTADYFAPSSVRFPIENLFSFN